MIVGECECDDGFIGATCSSGKYYKRVHHMTT